MLSVERLIAEHEQLDALAEALEAHVAAQQPDIPATLAAKSILSITLDAHLRDEDAGLYAKLAGRSDLGLGNLSLSLQQELESLRHDWSAYLTEWCDDAVESDWRNFVEETRRMMARLRDRIARENGYLFPLALQGSALSLRAA